MYYLIFNKANCHDVGSDRLEQANDPAVERAPKETGLGPGGQKGRSYQSACCQ